MTISSPSLFGQHWMARISTCDSLRPSFTLLMTQWLAFCLNASFMLVTPGQVNWHLSYIKHMASPMQLFCTIIFSTTIICDVVVHDRKETSCQRRPYGGENIIQELQTNFWMFTYSILMLLLEETVLAPNDPECPKWFFQDNSAI